MNKLGQPVGLVPPSGKKITVNLDELDEVVCESCSCRLFTTVFKLKQVPAMLSQTGKPNIAPIEYFKCANPECGKITNIIRGMR